MKIYFFYVVLIGVLSVPLSIWLADETFRGAILIYLISAPFGSALFTYLYYRYEKRQVNLNS